MACKSSQFYPEFFFLLLTMPFTGLFCEMMFKFTRLFWNKKEYVCKFSINSTAK